ncbi:MAG: hypothetical protein IJ689_05295 [Alphaproteobacteria bacterium]|nr:hypothetical protein [Alphaproteobacteria bacterium]
MTNKTFLILLLTGVSYTAYNAAAVSENFAISTTIDHEITLGSFRVASADANLDISGDISLGTIYINPTYSGATTSWGYSSSGVISYINQGAIVRADNQTVGKFTADVPNPDDCAGSLSSYSCAGLTVTGTYVNSIAFFGGNGSSNWCHSYIKYSGNDNLFNVFLTYCKLGDIAGLTTGTKTGRLTVSYTPES